MKDFIEKWNTDSKFKAKTQLGLYTLFVVLVSIFAISTRPTSTNTTEYDNNVNDVEINDKEIINIPEKYSYTKIIKIDELEYKYEGNKNADTESIVKTTNEEIVNYLYQDGEYYRKENEVYILTTKEEVYNIMNYNYLELETINKYLSKSTISNEEYLVYLKDIILDSNSNDYIIIKIEMNKINIDYTALMRNSDENIEKYLVEIIIEEIK